MTPVFADTWYFLALMNPNEQGHQSALDWSRRTVPIMTSEYVLLELGNTLSPVHWRPRFISLIGALRNHPAMTIVPASASLLESGITLFSDRLDKDWSLTDCISFTFMIGHALHDALTADAHFQQAGFRALLLE